MSAREPLPVGTRVEIERAVDWPDPIISVVGDGHYWVEILPFQGASVRTCMKVAVDAVRRREARVTFGEREMRILRAVFRGECCADLLGCGDHELSPEEMDAFLAKLQAWPDRHG